MVSALYSNSLKASPNGTLIANGTDLNNIVTVGNYYSNSSAVTNSLAHCPVTGTAFRLVVLDIGYSSVAYGRQLLMTNLDTWVRYNMGGASQVQWNEWKKVPTRAEVDALNNSMTKIILSESLSVPKDSSATVTLPSKTGSFLCAWRGTNAVWRGIALITKASTSDGICTVLHSNMSSVSESGNVLTFTNQHSSNDQTYYIRVTEIGV